MSSMLGLATVQSGSWIGASVRISSVLWRSVWLSEITCWFAGSGGGVAPRADQPVMGGQDRVEVAGELHARVDQHDQVVAGPLEVGDQVRGEHDAELVLGDGLHQVLQELAPGERVEAGDRLVEDQQLGALGDAERQRQLRALAAGELARLLLGVEAEPLDPPPRQRRRPSPGSAARRAAGGRATLSPP